MLNDDEPKIPRVDPNDLYKTLEIFHEGDRIPTYHLIQGMTIGYFIFWVIFGTAFSLYVRAKTMDVSEKNHYCM